MNLLLFLCFFQQRPQQTVYKFKIAKGGSLYLTDSSKPRIWCIFHFRVSNFWLSWSLTQKLNMQIELQENSSSRSKWKLIFIWYPLHSSLRFQKGKSVPVRIYFLNSLSFLVSKIKPKADKYLKGIATYQIQVFSYQGTASRRRNNLLAQSDVVFKSPWLQESPREWFPASKLNKRTREVSAILMATLAPASITLGTESQVITINAKLIPISDSTYAIKVESEYQSWFSTEGNRIDRLHSLFHPTDPNLPRAFQLKLDGVPYSSLDL